MDYQTIALGCAGGLLPDVLRLVSERYGPAPAYLKQGFFWLSLLILAGLGGLAAFLLHPTGVVEALAVGFSAPEILSKLLKREPSSRGGALPPDPKRDAQATAKPVGLRTWWAA